MASPQEFIRGRLETCCPFLGRLGSKCDKRNSLHRKIPTPALIIIESFISKQKKAIRLWLDFQKLKSEY